MGVSIHTGRGSVDITARLRRMERFIENPSPLLKEWGVIMLRDVGQTFRAGGRPAWKPLSDRTIVGRRKMSSSPLQNDGYLRRSFDTEQGKRTITLFSHSKLAPYHEYGTGTHAGRGKYWIRPRRAKWLTIPTAPLNLSGLGESPRAATGGFIFMGSTRWGKAGRSGGRSGTIYTPKRFKGRMGKTVSAYKGFSFVKEVHHPGVPARPMLPDPARLVPRLQAAVHNVFRQQVQQGGA